jgi:hypothetical protein
MSMMLRAGSFCAVLLSAGGAYLSVQVADEKTRPEPVITDTPQYCLQLLDRVSRLVRIAPSPPPEEVASLSTEGRRMCDQGQVRGGILRLRRALMLMRQQESGIPAP